MRLTIALLLLALLPQESPDPEHPIDAALGQLWAERGITPAADASDAEFLRRLRLDLTGHIPTVEEARAFAADASPHKRPKLIDKLLASDEFVDFWSGRITNSMLGYARGFEYGNNRAGFADWIRRQVADDRGWDQIVSDMLTASGAPGKKPEVAFLTQFFEYTEKGQRLKLEELTGKISTSFLGIRLRCAQCHDHPFDRYTQEDFFGMVAFFQKTGPGAPVRGELQDGMGGPTLKTHKQPLKYEFEHWTRDLTPRFFDGPPPETENLRVEFTEMLTRHDQFARSYVNRVWAYLFGRGIVDPYDDFSPRHRPVAGQLLESLVTRVRNDKFSIRALVRLIVTSKAYQRTSRATKDQDATEQEKYFARSSTRPLSPEQLWNAIDRATELRQAAEGGGINRTHVVRLAGVYQSQMGNVTTYDMLRNWFLGMLVRTANPDAPTALGQYSANVQQVLYAMNVRSPIWSGAYAEGDGRLGRLTLEGEKWDVLIEEVFLAAFGRTATKAESERCKEHVRRAAAAGEGKSKTAREKHIYAAYQEIFWALLNADEFIFNH